MSDVQAALDDFAAHQPQYTKYHAYYNGEHPLMFATDKFRNAFGPLFQAFADNLCRTVVDAVADRLQITGFVPQADPTAPPPPPARVPGMRAAPPPDPAAVAAWGLWQTNRMQRRAGEAHLEALTTGDSYVIVWPDAAGAPTIYPQRAAAMALAYDEETPGVVVWAAKTWITGTGTIRLTLYYPDRLEKYETRKAGAMLPRKAGDFTAIGTVPNPWARVPVFHFAANAGIGERGRSDLGDVTKLQDALNKSVCDMLVGMEFTAFPQRYATGLEVELDELTGRPLAPFVPGADRVWAVGDPAVKFGEFAAAGLDNYLHVQDNLRLEIARVSRTPLHYMALSTGQRAPSGEALRIAEMPLVQKIQDRMIAFGETWGDALSLALRMIDVPGLVVPDWRDPTPHSELEDAQKLQIWGGLGVPEPVLWKEMGYSDQEIEAMQGLKDAAAQQAVTLAQAAKVPPGGGAAPPDHAPVAPQPQIA